MAGNRPAAPRKGLVSLQRLGERCARSLRTRHEDATAHLRFGGACPSLGSVYYEAQPISEADLTLMRRMRITALYRKPNTSKKTPGHTIYPYLLRTRAITRSNHVWAMDISYIAMARGFGYLAAVIDWHSRRVLAWRLSISMDTTFRTEAVEEAIVKHGKPEILKVGKSTSTTRADWT